MAKKDLNTWTLVPAGKWISTVTGGIFLRNKNTNDIKLLNKGDKFFIPNIPGLEYEYRFKIAEAVVHIGDNQYDDAIYSIASGGGGGDPALEARVAALETQFTALEARVAAVEQQADDNTYMLKHSSASAFLGPPNVTYNPITIAENDSVLLSQSGLIASFNDSLRTDGSEWVLTNGTPYTSFFKANGQIQFPDIEVTDQANLNNTANARKYLLNQVTARVSGNFSGTFASSAFIIQYFSLDANGDPNLPLSVTEFYYSKNFLADFDNQGVSQNSRLSKEDSELVQNGADLLLVNPGGAGDFVLDELSLLLSFDN